MTIGIYCTLSCKDVPTFRALSIIFFSSDTSKTPSILTLLKTIISVNWRENLRHLFCLQTIFKYNLTLLNFSQGPHKIYNCPFSSKWLEKLKVLGFWIQIQISGCYPSTLLLRDAQNQNMTYGKNRSCGLFSRLNLVILLLMSQKYWTGRKCLLWSKLGISMTSFYFKGWTLTGYYHI